LPPGVNSDIVRLCLGGDFDLHPAIVGQAAVEAASVPVYGRFGPHRSFRRWRSKAPWLIAVGINAHIDAIVSGVVQVGNQFIVIVGNIVRFTGVYLYPGGEGNRAACWHGHTLIKARVMHAIRGRELLRVLP
jgi:hypothetical protein